MTRQFEYYDRQKEQREAEEVKQIKGRPHACQKVYRCVADTIWEQEQCKFYEPENEKCDICKSFVGQEGLFAICTNNKARHEANENPII